MALTQVSTNGIKNGTIATADLAATCVTTVNLDSGAVTNDKVNANAAIAGTKISPNFGSQNIATTGALDIGANAAIFGNLTISNATPTLIFTDNNNNDDFEVKNNNGVFTIRDATDSADRFTIASNGRATLANDAGVNGNLDVGNGIDVTGSVIATTNLDANNATSKVRVGDLGNDNYVQLTQETNSSSVRGFTNQHSNASVLENLQGTTNQHLVLGDVNYDNTGALLGVSLTQSGTTVTRLSLSGSGNLHIHNNITLGGTVDGVDIATRDTLFGGLTSSSGVLTNGVTATTQSAGDSSTKVATTAYTDTAIANLIDSSPGTLNTLNELAAALGDDANFSTTVTNSIATKLPLAGGTLTGDLTISEASPAIFFTDNAGSPNNPDYRLQANAGAFIIYDQTNSVTRLQVNTDGHIDVTGNLDVGAGLDVTGNIAVSGTVDGRDVASDGSKLDGIESGATADQTASEILTLIKTVDGSGSGLDADLLDGKHDTSFLRSDAGGGSGSYQADSDITFNGGAGAVTVSANSDIRFTNGNWTGESCKIQHHDNRLYIQGGSNGIQLRGSDGGGIVNFTNTQGTFFDDVIFSGDIFCNGGAGAVTINANSDIRLANGNWTGDSAAKIQHHNDSLYITGGSGAQNNIQLIFRNNSNTNHWYMGNNGHFFPASDSVYNIGQSGSRVNNFYVSAISANGDISAEGGAGAVTVSAGSDIRFTSGGWTGDAYGKIQQHNNSLYIGGGSSTEYSFIFRHNNADRVYIRSNGTIYPTSNAVSDLGKSDRRWANVYTNDLNLSNEGGANDVDGTWGSYTIQEGAEDLFLVNKRNGKKYKFNLTEVS